LILRDSLAITIADCAPAGRVRMESGATGAITGLEAGDVGVAGAGAGAGAGDVAGARVGAGAGDVAVAGAGAGAGTGEVGSISISDSVSTTDADLCFFRRDLEALLGTEEVRSSIFTRLRACLSSSSVILRFLALACAAMAALRLRLHPR